MQVTGHNNDTDAYMPFIPILSIIESPLSQDTIITIQRCLPSPHPHAKERKGSKAVLLWHVCMVKSYMGNAYDSYHMQVGMLVAISILHNISDLSGHLGSESDL